MLQYRYDTQLLIDGEDLDEDEIIPMSHGRCLNTVLRLERFTI